MADFIVINPDGTAECHLTERLDRIGGLTSLGNVEVKRVTSVEWDAEKQLWVAILLSTGEVICEGDVRKDVVSTEAAYVESLLWQQ